MSPDLKLIERLRDVLEPGVDMFIIKKSVYMSAKERNIFVFVLLTVNGAFQ